MAFVTAFTCVNCDTVRIEVITPGRVCVKCRGQESDRARRVHLDGLKGLTIEERLDRIEKELYDTAAKRRLGALEARNAVYG